MKFETPDLSSPKPLYMQVADNIVQKIRNKELAVGERLPAQNSLCKMFDISLYTLTEALSNLVEEGYISRRPNYGTFVISSEPKSPSLLKRKSGVCMVLCTTTELAGFDLSGDAMYQMILKGIQAKTREHGAFLGYTIIYDNETELHLGKMQDDIAGLIVAGSKTSANLKAIRKMNMPYVMIGDLIDRADSEPEVDVITNNDFDGTYIATKHLTGLGHKRIAFFNESSRYSWNREKLEGYKKALSEANIDFDKDLVIEIETYNSETGHRLMKEFLEKSIPFTGLIGYTFSYGYGIMQALTEKGLRIPEDISLVVLGLAAEYTSVFYDLEELGRLAFERLFYRLSTPGWKPERITVPHKLTIKNSTRKI